MAPGMSTIGGWRLNWEARKKHRKSTVREWDSGETVKWTKEKGDHSQYNPHLLASDADVRDLEIRCVNEGVAILGQSNKIRCFYMKRDDLGTVGACMGEYTDYVYAEWHMSGGAIHGRPISKKALRLKGIKIDE